MKIYSATIILMFISGLLNSQENSGKFYPAFSVTPQLTFLQHPDLDEEGKPDFGIKLETILAKGVSDNFQLGFGLNFQHVTLRQKGTDRRWPSEVEDGEYKPSKDEINDYKATYAAVGIPVMGRLYLGKKTNRFVISGVGSFNYIVSANHQHITNEPGSTQPNITDADEYGIEIRRFYFQIGTGLGYEFGFGKHHRLAVGPQFDYNLNDFIESGNVQNEPFPKGNSFFLGLRINHFRNRP